MGQSAMESNSNSSTSKSTSSKSAGTSQVWLVEIFPAEGCLDRVGAEVADDAVEFGLAKSLRVEFARGFLIEGDLTEAEVVLAASTLLAEPVVEAYSVRCVSDQEEGATDASLVYVLPKPGVTDVQAESAFQELRSLGLPVEALRTCRRYRFGDASNETVHAVATRLLSNDAIEQVHMGSLQLTTLSVATQASHQRVEIPLREASDEALVAISQEGGLSLTLVEMQTIRDHFIAIDREPTDIELETVAQTWSEHCSHKTLAGQIEYTDEQGTRSFGNMLKETIFSATETIRSSLGAEDWCVSVFRDNAGIIDFDGEHCLTFKVETHNRPSAIEPYGGANTGIGGVIRDTLGTGLGARPVCNTDVFCFAAPDTAADQLPPGVLHPRRIMKSVVAGVRDYGNRMGIPTVNGAVYFDPRYVGNPLVFCGNVGILPRQYTEKRPQAGDLIVTIGGRTGRDGIHGATFSSAELTEESETTSGGAVQIGNAITEKMVLDVLLQARDRELYSAVTDCGAGGFSSAVGEMGEEIGAIVWLEKAPLKYAGLSYTEIWISEAQERMVFAVPKAKWDEFKALCESESVEATAIGEFEATGKLHLTYEGETVGRMEMAFLHDGRPKVTRQAVWSEPDNRQESNPAYPDAMDWGQQLKAILGSGNVASKHWIIRQYDHEVLGGSVIKPLVGVNEDGPSDAAVIRPLLNSRRGAVIACGMNPWFGDIDPWHMAMSAIDEAVRNCVATGADPDRIAILDNFCWGYTDRPETLGALVRAALACQELAIQLGTPFISGKDSLNNEFSYTAPDGTRETIRIPSTLLISALGQVADVEKCVTMDFKTPGNRVLLIGDTRDEMGGSHFHVLNGWQAGRVPSVDGEQARHTFVALHKAIQAGLVHACHDLSEGGLAACLAEMAFAGGWGVTANINDVLDEAMDATTRHAIGLFSESNTRFVCEVPPESVHAFRAALADVKVTDIGEVTAETLVQIESDGVALIREDNANLKSAWLSPFDWN